MTQLLNFILTQILIYGYPIIFSAILIAYVGVPIPLNALILAAGAFTTDHTLNLYLLVPLVATTAIMGDIFNYYLGKRFGYLIVNKYTRKIGLSQHRLESVDQFLSRWGGGCIFLTRWLLTPLGIPVNLIAGIHHYSFKKFIIWAVIGEIMWSTLYISLGNFFGANWVSLLSYVNDAPTLFTAIFAGVILLIVGSSMWKKFHLEHNV